MRRIKEILELRHGHGLSHRDVGVSVGVSASTVGELLGRVRAAGLAWPLDAALDDAALEARLYRHGAPGVSGT